MRLFNVTKSFVAATLTLSLAGSGLGCAAAVGVGGDDNVGATSQAVAVGSVLSGAQAAIRIVGMLGDYGKYGRAEVSTAEILDTVKKVQADLDALRGSVDKVQQEIIDTHTDVLNVEVLKTGNVIRALWDGYAAAAASTDATVLPAFLAQLRTGTTGLGDLHLADLQTMNDLIVGGDSSRSLLTLVKEQELLKGINALDHDAIGNFFAEKQQLQERGFFLLSEANADNPTFPKDALAQHKQLMTQQVQFFYATMRAYNASLREMGMKAREAQVTECTCVDLFCTQADWMSGWKFSDSVGSRTWPAVRDDGTSWSYTWSQCNQARTDWIGVQTTVARELESTKFCPAEKVYLEFKLLDVAGDYVFTKPSGEKVPATIRLGTGGDFLTLVQPGNPACALTPTSQYPSFQSAAGCRGPWTPNSSSCYTLYTGDDTVKAIVGGVTGGDVYMRVSE